MQASITIFCVPVKTQLRKPQIHNRRKRSTTSMSRCSRERTGYSASWQTTGCSWTSTWTFYGRQGGGSPTHRFEPRALRRFSHAPHPVLLQPTLFSHYSTTPPPWYKKNVLSRLHCCAAGVEFLCRQCHLFWYFAKYLCKYIRLESGSVSLSRSGHWHRGERRLCIVSRSAVRDM